MRCRIGRWRKSTRPSKVHNSRALRLPRLKDSTISLRDNNHNRHKVDNQGRSSLGILLPPTGLVFHRARWPRKDKDKSHNSLVWEGGRMVLIRLWHDLNPLVKARARERVRR